MTRETKIGLLVGLAFIIVVAILLSDPVNNSAEPPAQIADTASIVRQSLTVPAPTNPQPTGSTAIVNPGRAPGHDPILTPAEAAQETAQAVVHVGPGVAPLRPIIPTSPSQVDSPASAQPTVSQDQGNTVVTPAAPPTHLTTDDLQRIAAEHGDRLIPADSHDVTSVNNNDAGESSPAAPSDDQHTSVASAGKQYTAQAGDSVSKMAARLMGANTKANRAAIIAANPSLKKDPNRVIVGAAYVIPVAATASTPAAPATPAHADPDAQSPAPTQVAQTPAHDKQPSRWYVVKANDNLWRIATNEVGDSSAVAQIISLNKDILKGGNTLRPNMRLRLPPKTVASAD